MMSKPYLLLLGSLQEPILAYVSMKLARKAVTLVVMDFRQPCHDWPIVFSWGEGAGEPFLSAGRRLVPLVDIRSTYIRLGQVWKGTEEGAPDALHHRSVFPHLLSILPGLVVNPYEASNGNGTKPYQLMRIAQFGFNVPRTLVTSIPERAKEFFDVCRGRVIYKSISSVRSIVRRVTEDDLPRLEQIRHCPVQFQEYIPGVDLRVHVVGNRVFASQIETTSMDYRYTDEQSFRTIRAVELPMGLQEQCIGLARGLGLALAGIDLRRTVQGEYYCFEVNTSPAFTFYEEHTGQRIGDALVDMLCRGTV